MAEKKKYDTNPLDPDFVKRADEEWETTRALRPEESPVEAETRHLAPDKKTTASQQTETRQRGVNPTSYPSVFIPPVYQPPAQYTPPQHPWPQGKPGSRKVTGVNLPENWMTAMAYCPAYIGLVVSLIELLVVPRNEVRVRFHAAQGLALHVAIMAISILFWVIGLLTGSHLGGTLFSIAAFCFLITSMIRVARGESNHVAAIDEGTKWLNEHVKPKNR